MSDEKTVIAIECFLSALSQSSESDSFILRGSFVSRDWMKNFSRPVRDLDLLSTGDLDPESWKSLFVDCLSNIEISKVSFACKELRYENIWKESISPGARFFIPYFIDAKEYELQIDISVGDPVVVPLVQRHYKSSEGHDFSFKSIPIEVAAAWKLHGLFEHLSGQWQSKTLWDLYLLCRYNNIDEKRFIESVEVAFSSRLDPLISVKRLLFGDFGKSKSSKKRWAKEVGELADHNFKPLEDVIEWLKVFLIRLFKIDNDNKLLTLSELIDYRVELLRSNSSPEAENKLKTLKRKSKFLSHKAYNSILHVPGSRVGSSGKTLDSGRFSMLTSRRRQPSDVVVVQEKLDGSCVCAYRSDNEIFALGRGGDLAAESPNESRRLWAEWVVENENRFMQLLNNGERACGEWLAMAHGTRYDLTHEPFVLFDVFNEKNRALNLESVTEKNSTSGFQLPHTVHCGEPISLEQANLLLGANGFHGAIDESEGLIWRLERDKQTLFRGKYVRPEKIDGKYLSENTGKVTIWNWRK